MSPHMNKCCRSLAPLVLMAALWPAAPAFSQRGQGQEARPAAYALNKPTSNVLFWAVTVVNAPREIRGARLAIGSNAASVWWVNGTEATALYNDRQAVIDDGVSK